MRLIEEISEDAMVAVFLKTEIMSARFGKDILALLKRDGAGRDILDTPDIHDGEQNAYRAALLGEYRGYRQNRDLFTDYSENASWYRATLTKEELANVRYIDYSYWNEISNGTRLPIEAAKTIHTGRKTYGQSNEGFLKMAQALREGAQFPELILIGTSPDDLIVMEGHVRLTAYFLAPECLPEELIVIVGFAPEFASW
jgi:hypothetical protein